MELREQLIREMADNDAPPIGSLVSDAVNSGNRARRRRYGLIGGATAGLAVAIVVGTIAALTAMPGTAAVGPAAGGPQSSTAPSPAAPSGKPTDGRPSAAPTAYAAGKPVVKLLEHLVAPHGHFTEVAYDQGSFLYNDGHGAATISARVSDAPVDYGADVVGMACPAPVRDFVCEVRNLSKGAVARIATMGPYGDCTEAKCSIQDRRVEIRRADGTYVVIDAFNGPAGHNRAATRTRTILSTKQLLVIATDPRWSVSMT